MHDDVRYRRDESSAGDGEYPGQDDTLAPGPADRADGFDCSDSKDGAGDGMSGGNRNLSQRRADDGGGGRQFSTKTTDGLKACDDRSHGLYDSPASIHRAQSNRGMAGENDGHAIFMLNPGQMHGSPVRPVVRIDLAIGQLLAVTAG